MHVRCAGAADEALLHLKSLALFLLFTNVLMTGQGGGFMAWSSSCSRSSPALPASCRTSSRSSSSARAGGARGPHPLDGHDGHRSVVWMAVLIVLARVLDRREGGVSPVGDRLGRIAGHHGVASATVWAISATAQSPRAAIDWGESAYAAADPLRLCRHLRLGDHGAGGDARAAVDAAVERRAGSRAAAALPVSRARPPLSDTRGLCPAGQGRSDRGDARRAPRSASATSARTSPISASRACWRGIMVIGAGGRRWSSATS